MGLTYQEEQEQRLFSDGLFSRKFPNDEDFIDYSMRNRYIKKLQKEYEFRKDEIQRAIELLISQYKNSDNSEKTILAIGAAYWDNKQKVDVNTAREFKEIIDFMEASFGAKEKEN